MKSAAFNLAFKVHRNELPFAEGLLKSVEADAQHDFIEALNSLAGEMRYDAGKMDALIEEAQQGLEPKKKPKFDYQALKDEIYQLKKNHFELKESIKSMEARVASLKPTIIPGINAFFAVIVGLVIVMIVYLLGIPLLAIVALVGTVIGALVSLLHDMNILKKQQADIAQKKLRLVNQIAVVNAEIATLEPKIKEKEDFLRSVMPSDMDESVGASDDSDS